MRKGGSDPNSFGEMHHQRIFYQFPEITMKYHITHIFTEVQYGVSKWMARKTLMRFRFMKNYYISEYGIDFKIFWNKYCLILFLPRVHGFQPEAMNGV